MIVPIAIGATALFVLSRMGKKEIEPSVDATPAAITELTAEEYETFNAGMGAAPFEASVLLAVLPDEELEADDLAAKLGELGYTQLGIAVIDVEGFDPNRARLRIEREDMRFDEIMEDDSLEDFLADIDARVASAREAAEQRAEAAGLSPGEMLSHGRGVESDGEHGMMTGRGLVGRSPLADVPVHLRPAARREMRRAMKRGVTRNPHVAARLAKRKIAK